MRCLLLMYPGMPEDGEWVPDAEAVAAMTRFNEELGEAGVLLALDGLHATRDGARVSFAAGAAPAVQPGPFNAGPVVGGYWILQTGSLDQAIEWASRAPASPGDVIEVRRIFEMSDFPADVQAAAGAGEAGQPSAG